MKSINPASIIATLLLLFSCLASAQEKKFALGPALGNDVAAYGKVFGLEPKPKDFFWFGTVPGVGKFKLRWTEKQPVVIYAKFWFSDPAVASWQMAFKKLGLAPTKTVVTRKTSGESKTVYEEVSFTTENGKKCEAVYSPVDEEDNTKIPTIEFEFEGIE